MGVKYGLPLMIAVLFSSADSEADISYPLVAYECDQKHDRVSVELREFFNVDKREGVVKLKENEWELWKLVVMKGDTIKDVIKIKKVCILSDGKYNVEMSPVPLNNNVLGRCGAGMDARAKVRWHDRNLVSDEIGGTCDDGPGYGTITVQAQTHKITRVPGPP